jgi:two-component system nitrate/nitrite response regulator NarL
MAVSGEVPSGFFTEQQNDDAAPRVLVVSDIRLFREALTALLGHEHGIAVVGDASPPQASALVNELRPDIVLFDASRHGSLDYAKQIAERRPASKVVAFGVVESDAEIVALAAAGVVGYICNDAAAENVVAVLTSAMRDELLCSPRAAATLCHQVALLSRDGRRGPARAALSRRELQIAGLIERGLSNKEIARRLGIEAATVRNHVHNILDKLKVHRRGEAAACLRTASRARSPGVETTAPSD